MYRKSLVIERERDIPEKSDWENLIVKTTKLLNFDFSKVVLSRKKEFNLGSETTIKQVSNFLKRNNKKKNSYEFFLQKNDTVFYSMSPETLF